MIRAKSTLTRRVWDRADETCEFSGDIDKYMSLSSCAIDGGAGELFCEAASMREMMAPLHMQGWTDHIGRI